MQLDMQAVLPWSSTLAHRLLLWSVLLVTVSVQQQGLGSGIVVCGAELVAGGSANRLFCWCCSWWVSCVRCDKVCQLCCGAVHGSKLRVSRAFCVWEQDTVVGWWVNHVHCADIYDTAVGRLAQFIDDEGYQSTASGACYVCETDR
jgi:hypothetical protein